MKLRYYDAAFPDPNLVSELEVLFNSGSQSAMEAASRFISALRRMQTDGQVYGKQAGDAVRAHYGKAQSEVFGGNVLCMYRQAEGHVLYLTFTPQFAASPRQAELRALHINGQGNQSTALPTTVARHKSFGR